MTCSTPGSLTGGKAIAGTGEIDGEGKVGPIGGIQQKLVGAQDDGARLFLVLVDNCAEAAARPLRPQADAAREGDDAGPTRVADVKAWVKDPDAELPGCA